MPYAKTRATIKIANLQKRIRAIQGGTSAGKTVAILQVLIVLAVNDKKGTLTSVVSESFPHLKRGAIRDFLSIMESNRLFNPSSWNKTDYTYTFPNGSKIEFFSADQPGKVRGPRRDRLFINEANNVPYETFDQLEVRTNECIYLDWNPTNEFWYYSDVANRSDVDHLILTYKDNEALSRDVVASIEQRRDKASWWKVYGEGQLGELEGKIYTNWDIVDEIPRFARLERYGLDFGYSNDPTTIVAIYYFQGAYILDEITYQKGLSNKQIADIINNQPQRAMVVADSAEPKSIDELKMYGINAQPSSKGRDSVEHGIQMVQEQKIAVTKRSLNVIKEYRNYLWETDREGRVRVNPSVPEHQYSHTMDAIRYGIVSLVGKPKPKVMASPAVKPYYPSLGL